MPKNAIGPRPAHRHLQDAPVAGDAVVVSVEGPKGWRHSVSLLGAGRDAESREAIVENFERTQRLLRQNAPDLAINYKVSQVYTTMTALVADHPEARLDGTAKGILRAEQAVQEQRQATAQWQADLEAAGLEPCERCGGAGGHKGWPGYTCYDCGGRGTQEQQ